MPPKNTAARKRKADIINKAKKKPVPKKPKPKPPVPKSKRKPSPNKIKKVGGTFTNRK